MKNNISNYRKSAHFMFRQWDRGIADELLFKLIPYFPHNKTNVMVIVSRKIVQKLNNRKEQELFIKIDKHVLITCFYASFQEYIQKCTKQQEYYILNATCINRKKPTKYAF